MEPPGAIWVLFALGYAVICVTVWLACWRLARRNYERLEARHLAEVLAASVGHESLRGSSGVYRGRDPQAAAPPLVTGCLPRPEQVWSIAYLRAGLDAVRELLVARAFLEGVIEDHSRSGLFDIRVIERPCDDAVLSAYQRALGPPGGGFTRDQIRDAAQSIATQHRPQFEADVVSSGLKRPGLPRPRIAWVACSILAVPNTLLVGLGWLALFAIVPNREGDPSLQFARTALGVATTAMAFATWLLLARFCGWQGSAAAAYLKWLDTVSPNVRLDAPQSLAPQPDVAALAIAVRGFEVLSDNPRFPPHFQARFVRYGEEEDPPV